MTNLEGAQKRLLVLDNQDSQGWVHQRSFLRDGRRWRHYPCAEVTWYGAAAYGNYPQRHGGIGAPCFNFTNWACDFSKNMVSPADGSGIRKGSARRDLTGHYFPLAELWRTVSRTTSTEPRRTTWRAAIHLGAGDAGNSLAVTPNGYYDGTQVVTNQAGQLLAGQDMANGYGSVPTWRAISTNGVGIGRICSGINSLALRMTIPPGQRFLDQLS